MSSDSLPQQLSMFDPIEIPLTRGYVALVDSVDAELFKFKWCYTHGYAARKESNLILFLHRIVLARMLGRTLNRNESVDHINGNRQDNRRQNLRLATYKENGRNRRLSSANNSGYKGVIWHKGGQKWQAQVKVDGTLIYLGLFADPIDAALAYDAAAIEHFGPFAKTNAMLGLLPGGGK
jgi:hypothetical protein